MNPVTKQRLRVGAILLLCIIGLLITVANLQVESADYRATLQKQVEASEKVLQAAEVGTEKGQYSQEAADLFEEQIAEARGIAEDENSYYELQKAACEALKEETENFQDSANKVTIVAAGSSETEAESGTEASDDTDAGDEAGDDAGDGSSGTETGGSSSGTGSGGSSAGTGTGGGSGTVQSESGTDTQQPEDNRITVTISINCHTLTGAGLSSLVDENLARYVPDDGNILSQVSYQCEQGTSVYEILTNVCRNYGIHMESSYSAAYNSAYIEGINYLYEFDGGTSSGWLYKVNGVFPNYGCSQYYVEDGDNIVWAYTCTEGDVAGDWM